MCRQKSDEIISEKQDGFRPYNTPLAHACRTTSLSAVPKRHIHLDMASAALRYAVLLLLGYAQCYAAVGSDGGLGVQMGERITSTTATAFSGQNPDGPGPNGHASFVLSGTVTSNPSLHAKTNYWRDGMPSPGRRLLHGCHGKRSADRNRFVKCGPPGLNAWTVLTHARRHTLPAHAPGVAVYLAISPEALTSVYCTRNVVCSGCTYT